MLLWLSIDKNLYSVICLTSHIIREFYQRISKFPAFLIKKLKLILNVVSNLNLNLK